MYMGMVLQPPCAESYGNHSPYCVQCRHWFNLGDQRYRWCREAGMSAWVDSALKSWLTHQSQMTAKSRGLPILHTQLHPSRQYGWSCPKTKSPCRGPMPESREFRWNDTLDTACGKADIFRTWIDFTWATRFKETHKSNQTLRVSSRIPPLRL